MFVINVKTPRSGRSPKRTSGKTGLTLLATVVKEEMRTEKDGKEKFDVKSDMLFVTFCMIFDVSEDGSSLVVVSGDSEGNGVVKSLSGRVADVFEKYMVLLS